VPPTSAQWRLTLWLYSIAIDMGSMHVSSNPDNGVQGISTNLAVLRSRCRCLFAEMVLSYTLFGPLSRPHATPCNTPASSSLIAVRKIMYHKCTPAANRGSRVFHAHTTPSLPLPLPSSLSLQGYRYYHESSQDRIGWKRRSLVRPRPRCLEELKHTLRDAHSVSEGVEGSF
jgi:hypothetical protein